MVPKYQYPYSNFDYSSYNCTLDYIYDEFSDF